MNKISKAAAVLAVAAATVFAAPAVASAYTPSEPGTGPATLVAGASGTYSADVFVAGESVTFTLTGEGVTSANLALVSADSVDSTSVVKEADANGEASAVVTLPEDASGSYSLTAVGESGATADFPTISVAATSGDAGGVLTPTGFDGEQLLGLWVGGGILVLAGASIAVATSVRRARQTA